MLPAPPKIQLRILGDYPDEKPFLEVRRLRMVAEYPDGSVSEPFIHDIVIRKKTDAVVIIAYYMSECEPIIYLRSAVRPALAHRFVEGGNLWELPAGLIEPNEGPIETVVREIKEELGFDVKPEDVVELGLPVFTSVGVLAEQLFFYRVKIDPARRGEPTLDGSALEKGASIGAVCLNKARCMVMGGHITDMKTELGIRRLSHIAGMF